MKAAFEEVSTKISVRDGAVPVDQGETQKTQKKRSSVKVNHSQTVFLTSLSGDVDEEEEEDETTTKNPPVKVHL